jgi:hypothetical protein
MTKPTTIADLLERGSAENLIGRTRELALLGELLAPGGPVVAYVHGPYGIGKSALLAALHTPLALRGVRSVRIDGDAVEPQPEAVIAAVASALGAECRTLPELVRVLADRRPTVIVIDNIDALRLAASWLRRDLVPALPAHTRLAVAGRLPPPVAWVADLGAMFMSIPLVPLEREVALIALCKMGLDDDAAGRVWEISQGHPLSLRMALQAARAGALEAVDTLGELCDAIIEGAGVPSLARMVQAAAVVRRVTRPLLAAMLGGDALEDLDAFAALPFVALDREGHYLAEPVRRLQSTRLLAVEPRFGSEARAVELRHLPAEGRRPVWNRARVGVPCASGAWACSWRALWQPEPDDARALQLARIGNILRLREGQRRLKLGGAAPIRARLRLLGLAAALGRGGLDRQRPRTRRWRRRPRLARPAAGPAAADVARGVEPPDRVEIWADDPTRDDRPVGITAPRVLHPPEEVQLDGQVAAVPHRPFADPDQLGEPGRGGRADACVVIRIRDVQLDDLQQVAEHGLPPPHAGRDAPLDMGDRVDGSA